MRKKKAAGSRGKRAAPASRTTKSRAVKPPHFLVHNSEDSVGVAAVEDISAGQILTGWVMDTDATIRIKSLDTIPLGHKVALKAHAKGDTVVKYGHDIGKVVKAFGKGAHCHVQNTKTKRW